MKVQIRPRGTPIAKLKFAPGIPGPRGPAGDVSAALLKANSLSDLSDKAAARANLGLDTFGSDNLLINGDMRFAQRGTSVSVAALTWTYLVDRWVVLSPAPVTITQAVGTAYGGQSYLRVTGTNLTNLQYVQSSQRIKAAEIADYVGQTVTVSFSIAVNYGTGAPDGYVLLGIPGAKDDFSNVVYQDPPMPFVANITPGRKSVTFTVPAGALNGLEIAIRVWNNGSAATGAFSFNLGTVKLEPRAFATPFIRRPDPIELLLCQEYFRAIRPGGSGGRVANGIISSATQGLILLNPSPPMRTVPALAVSAVSDWSLVAGATVVPTSALAIGASSSGGAVLLSADVASSSFTAGHAAQLRAANANAALYLNAEL